MSIADVRCACARIREDLGLKPAEGQVRITVTLDHHRAVRLADDLHAEGTSLGPNYHLYKLHEEPDDFDVEQQPENQLVLIADKSLRRWPARRQ